MILENRKENNGKESKHTGKTRRLIVFQYVLILFVGILLGCSRYVAIPMSDSKKDDKRFGKRELGVPTSIGSFHMSLGKSPVSLHEENLWEYMNGGAQQIILLGFKTLTAAEYERPGTDQQVLLEVFSMQTVKAAKALFDLWRFDEGEKVNVCDDSQRFGNMLSFQKGTYYVRIGLKNQFDGDSENQRLIEKMGSKLCEMIEEDMR